MLAVSERQNAALAQHDVEIELAAQTLVELQRMIVEGCTGGIEIIRATHLRVATRVATADPALLEHGDISNAVLPGEIVSSREPMPTAADDHHLVAGLRRWRTPGPPPALVSPQRIASQIEERIPLHGPIVIPDTCVWQ